MTRALETRLPALGTNCEFGYSALQPIQFRIGQAGSGLYVLGGVEVASPEDLRVATLAAVAASLRA